MRRATLSGAESARASHGGFAPSVSASAYFDAPSAPPRATVEPTRLTRSFHATRRTAGYDDAWTGVYGEHGGVGKSAVRLSAVPALARVLPDDGARPGGADGRTTPLNELELDVNTANVLAKQQAQLLELHAQVESLKAQLSRSRGRAAGEFRDGGSLRTSSEWDARGGGANANAVDASTNTLWRPEMASHAISHSAGSRPETEPADAWSYEGGGRKSRGTATDGDGGGEDEHVREDEHVACVPASADDPMRRSGTRSGLRVIRRSFAGRPGDAAAGTSAAGTSAAGPSAPRLSPAKPSDLAADASSASAAEPAFAAMPPLPPPSRPDMRAIRRRELVTDRDGGEDEPAGRAYAPPPTATAATRKDARKSEAVELGDGTTDAFERGFETTGLRDFETTDLTDFARASFSASSRRLIPSQNSAFTPVAGEALGGDGRATALRAAERAAETRAEDRDARRVGVDRGFLFEKTGTDVGADIGTGSNDDTHKMRVVVPPRAFARVPLFAEGDGSPSSPGRGDDDADSEVLRVSRDTFAELSLRGAAEGARSEEGDEPDVEDDGTDAGTAVTGTTAGRGASEWALPARWGPSQRMSEEVCWEDEEGRDFGAKAGKSGNDASAPSGRTSPAVDDASYLSPRALLGGGSPRRSVGRSVGLARSSDSDSERERERERDYARPGDAAAEDVPTIAYQPMSDDESSDDEEMRAIYAKYSVGATTR